MNEANGLLSASTIQASTTAFDRLLVDRADLALWISGGTIAGDSWGFTINFVTHAPECQGFSGPQPDPFPTMMVASWTNGSWTERERSAGAFDGELLHIHWEVVMDPPRPDSPLGVRCIQEPQIDETVWWQPGDLIEAHHAANELPRLQVVAPGTQQQPR